MLSVYLYLQWIVQHLLFHILFPELIMVSFSEQGRKHYAGSAFNEYGCDEQNSKVRFQPEIAYH